MRKGTSRRFTRTTHKQRIRANRSLVKFMCLQTWRIKSQLAQVARRHRTREDERRRPVLEQLDCNVLGLRVTGAIGRAKPTLTQLDGDPTEHGV